MSTRQKCILFTFLLIYNLCLFKITLAQSNTDRIVFLNLKLVKGKPYLENIKIVKGKLKQPRKMTFMTGQVYHSVLNNTDERLFEGLIPDPSRIHFEYVDEQGQMQSKIIEKDSANFFIRIPHNPAIHKVNLERIREFSVWGWALFKRRQSMGSILINLNEEENEN